MILISTWGWTRPTVETRRSSGSSVVHWVDTGEVSVMPYAIVISGMCITVWTFFITSTGHGEPAMIPVRSELKSKSLKRACSSAPMNLEDKSLAEARTSAFDLAEHRYVIGLPEASGQDQEADARLVQGVLELRGAVGGIDVDEDRAHRGGRVLDDDPLVSVGRPDANPIALLDAARDEPASDLLALGDQLAVRGAVRLMRDHQSLAITEAGRRAAQVLEDRLAKERPVACPVNVARHIHAQYPLDIVVGSSQGGGNSFSVRDRRQFAQRLASKSRQRP